MALLLYDFSIDATLTTNSLGRLVNDGVGQACNAKMIKLVLKNQARLSLFATRPIEEGEEITYDYGDKTAWWRNREQVIIVNKNDFRPRKYIVCFLLWAEKY